MCLYLVSFENVNIGQCSLLWTLANLKQQVRFVTVTRALGCHWGRVETQYVGSCFIVVVLVQMVRVAKAFAFDANAKNILYCKIFNQLFENGSYLPNRELLVLICR